MIHWLLAEVLQERGIQNASQLKKALEAAGIGISRQALQKLIENEPQYLRLETAQIFCNVLDCSVDQFLIITPDQPLQKPTGIIKPFVGKPDAKNHVMTDPMGFFK
jgi:DNA-binding Xre family transcriptional regulator